MHTPPAASRALCAATTDRAHLVLPVHCVRPSGPARPALLASALLVAFVAACTTTSPAPVVDRTASPVVATPRPDIRPLPPVPSAVNPSLPGNTAGSQFHVVQRGETLYGIARSNGLDLNSLAAWNGMTTAQPLREGQVLRLQPIPGAVAGPVKGAATSASLNPSAPPATAIQGQPLPGPTSPPVLAPVGPTPVTNAAPFEAPLKRDPKAQRITYSDAALAAMQRSDGGASSTVASATAGDGRAVAVNGGNASAAAAPATVAAVDADIRPGNGVDRDGIAWTWPTTGKVASKFNDKAPMKGIDIAANTGTAVVAAATGKVIYVGKEPRGYGQMIVVRHAKETVSVYFHTDKIQVKEQQRVLLGQKLAEVGDSAGNKMHFEVRRQGRPLDPTTLMPR